jgi:hypothetical protein
MPGLKIDHAKCTECRMFYVVCREINLNAVVVSPTAQHLLEIDERCIYPKCTVCLIVLPGGRLHRGDRHGPIAGSAAAGSLDGKLAVAPATLTVET